MVRVRVLHFADLHLGVEAYGKLDPQTGLSTRLGDFLTAFDKLVDYALHHDIDLVLFCGDAYKTRDPTPTQQREFARLWALNSDLKENYELRRDAMRLYGTLTQNQNKNQRELLERIDTLPCHAPACPGEKK